MVALAFLFAAAHQTQQVDLAKDPALAKPITFRAPAANSKKVLSALAKASGLPLQASTAIQNEILMVKVTNAPAGEVMARLAKAVAGSWVMVDGRYTLTRTEADESMRARVDYDLTYQEVKKKLGEEQALAKEAKTFDDAAAKALINKVKQERGVVGGGDRNPQDGGPIHFEVIEKEMQAVPSGRLAARVLSLIKPELVAGCPHGRRTVFSTNPNAMELPLNLDLEAPVGQFVSEQNTWADALAGMDDLERMRLFQLYGGNSNAVGRVTVQPEKVNLIVERYDNAGGETNLVVQVLGQRSVLLGSSELRIPTGAFHKSLPPIKQDKEGLAIQFTPEEQAMVDSIAAMAGSKGGETKPISPELRRVLSRPDLNEILGSFPSDILIQTGDRLNKNVVADMPDAMLILGMAAIQGGKPTANTTIQLLQGLSDVLAPVSIDDRYIEIDGGLPLPGAFLAHRSDRPELAHLLSTGTDAIPMEALARYDTVGHGTQDDYLELLIGGALFPGFVAFTNERSFDALRILGTVMQGNDAGVAPSGTVPLRSLDAATLDCLKEIVFYQSPELREAPLVRGDRSQGPIDPCELFPNGLPANGTLTISITTKTAVFSGDGRGMAIEPTQLAWEQEVKLHPEVIRGSIVSSPTTKFKLGTMRKLTITVSLAEHFVQEFNYSENHLPSQEVLTFDQLPEDFKKSVKEQVDNYERSFAHQ